VPILCPLGRVAATMSSRGIDATAALWHCFGDVLEGEQGLRGGLRDYLKPALRGGNVLLLCDGLDELPAGGVREAVARAIRQLAAETRAAMVVTCRSLPYQSPGIWQLPAEEGWAVATIQPLAFGQVRAFVRAWYSALAETDSELHPSELAARITQLLSMLESLPRLRPLIRSPLLLTMIALLHYNNTEVPRDQARLYEECLQLLLERWEPTRTPGLERPGLRQRIGAPSGLEISQLRNVLHELAFQAYDRPRLSAPDLPGVSGGVLSC
jgi:predicted NACHT family NTPase